MSERVLVEELRQLVAKWDQVRDDAFEEAAKVCEKTAKDWQGHGEDERAYAAQLCVNLVRELKRAAKEEA